MKGWELIVFDFDGTLFRSPDVAYEGICDIFEKHFNIAPPPKKETFRSLSHSFEDFFYNHGVSRNVSVEELNHIWDAYVFDHLDHAAFYEYTRELLDACHVMGMRVAMVSGQLNKILRHQLQKFGIIDQFDAVHGAEPKTPTDKYEYLLKVCSKLGVAPENACYIDDTKNGITDAQRAGLKTVGITHGFGTNSDIRATNPDFVCHSLHEVHKLLTTVVVGIVGESGSGKDSFSRSLMRANTNHRFKINPRSIPYALPMTEIRFSDPLKEALAPFLNLEINRENMQTLPVALREKFGATVLADAIKERALEAPEHFVVLNGIRWRDDLEMLRKFPHNLLVHVTADERTRMERIRARDEKVGESKLSITDFIQQEDAESEQNIPIIGEQADWVFKNIWTLGALQHNAHRCYDELVLLTAKRIAKAL